MTDKPKKPETPGLSEATGKFEHKHATDTAWSELWQDWQRCEIEVDAAAEAADAAVDTLPEWAKEVRRKRAGYEDLPPDTPARRAAAELDTPEYRAARAGLDAAKQRYSDLGDAQTKVEERILATPAHTTTGALVKMRIGIRETILNYLGPDRRMPEESELGMYDRMLLAALADLESLAGSNIGLDEVDLRQGRTNIQRLYPQALAAHERMERSKDDSDGSWEKWNDLRIQIIQTPATGPQDVAIKLRISASGEIVDNPETLPEEGDYGWLRSAICDLERLAGGNATETRQDEDADPASPDTTTGRSGMPDGVKGTFLTLVEELDDIKDAANNMVPGAAYYVLVERAQELDEEMLETRAGTLAGVVWKLKELTRLLDNQPDISVSVYERRLAHSAMADVETLAAEQAIQV